MKNLTQSELAVLEHLSDTPQAISQREIARRSGMSVGLINAILKKLVKTGYVKTSNLNRRSIEYILTPQGFAQKARKSYHYVVDTVKRYQKIYVKFNELIEKLSAEGVTDFYLHGEGELANLVSTLFKEEGHGVIKRGIPSRKNKYTVILKADADPIGNGSNRVIDLINELNGAPVSKNTPLK